MNRFSPNQQAILDFLLKEKSGATADELVQKIGITKTAIKGHLDRLSDLGLLQFLDEVGMVGRPKRRYLLTEEAAEVFPKQYSWLSIQLLEQLSDQFDSKDLTQFMRALANRVYSEQKQNFENQPFDRRLRMLADLMNTLGYKAQVKKETRTESSFIEAFNCVYHGVAQKRTELCEFDRELIAKATARTTTLESCIAKGGACCRFHIRP